MSYRGGLKMMGTEEGQS